MGGTNGGEKRDTSERGETKGWERRERGGEEEFPDKIENEHEHQGKIETWERVPGEQGGNVTGPDLLAVGVHERLVGPGFRGRAPL
eukprot:928623-Rhodomonas_salina.1